MIDKFENITCNGCQMCKEVCPKQAIAYEVNNEGFWFPVVNYSKCIECGICVKKCPNKTQLKTDKKNPIVKAVWSVDDNVRMASTSGGLFYELATYILKNDGYVVGCVYNSDFKGAHHVIINKVNELSPLMVSKYVESDMEGIYPKIKDLLVNENKVLFVGAPCQCAGLLSYLGNSFENLLVVDFLCRGANSPKAWLKYVEYLEYRAGGKIISLRCKDKSKGWHSLGVSATFDNGNSYYGDAKHDLRVIAYHHGNLMERESCNDCKFKILPRYSDLTLGDFWGIDSKEVNSIEKGISLCFINSDNGQKVFDEISSRLHVIDKTLEDAIRGNSAIYKSAAKGKNRDIFLSQLDKVPFDVLVNKYKDRRPSIIKRGLFKIIRIIKRIIRR